MGLKGIFLAILIIYTIYLWWRVRKKAQKNSHKLVHWVLGGIAVYYGISTLIMIIGSDWCARSSHLAGSKFFQRKELNNIQIRISEVIEKTNFDNLDLITSNVDLSGLEVETAGDNKRAFILKDQIMAYLNDSRGVYTHILIDCPPSLSLLTIMALVASDSLLVPLQTEFFALEGVTQLMKTIERIKNNLNRDLSIRGILLTMYDKRNKLSGQVEREARNYFKEKVYQTVVPRNVRLSEAPSHGMPVLFYDKSCPGSKSYFNFTNEFINQEKIMESAAWQIR